MAQCPDDNDLYKAAASALGVENAVTTATPENGINTSVLNEYRKKYVERTAVIDELSESVASNIPSGQIITPQDSRSISAQSKFYASLIDKNDNYLEKKLADQYDARRLAAGLTKAEQSKYLGMVFNISKTFLNQRADFSVWAWRNANDTRFLTPSEQPIIQTADSARPVVRALQNGFAERQIKLRDSIIPIARRKNLDVMEVYHDLGVYANARHILNDNVNAWLLDRWKVQRDDIKSQLETIVANPGKKVSARRVQNLQKEYTRLEEIIPYLEENIENPEKPAGLVSAGYTNAQARDIMSDVLAKTGATREEAEAFCQALTEEFNHVTTKLAEAGLISTEQLKAFPDFQSYVSLISRNENFSGPVNEASRYMMGDFHTREGMTADPQSAAISLASYAQRAATEIGMQRLGIQLHELSIRKGDDIGLRSHDYNTLIKWKYSGSPEIQAKATDVLNSGGLVVKVQKKGAKPGELEFERRYVYFEPGYTLENGNKRITGMDLNKALVSDFKTESSLVNWLGRASSVHGQMFTRFSPMFPIVGGIRDGMERITHMTNRAFFADNGTKLNNWQVIRNFIYNTPRGLNTIIQAFTRSPENMSPAARELWAEFTSQGLLQNVTPGVRPEGRTLTDVLNPNRKPTLTGKIAEKTGADFLNKWVASLGPVGRRVIDVIDKWNNAWQNAAALTQYMTLKEAGMSPARAASHVLEPMNMSQKGSLTPFLQILSPFVVPTMQSAGALARTLGFTVNAKTPMDILKAGRNGWIGVAMAAGAYAALGPFMREAMGEDEAGNKKFDYTPLRDVISSIPIGPFDDKGTHVKLPVGFGVTRLGGVLAIGTQRVMQGLMTPADVAAEMIFTTAKDVIPASMPQYKFTDKPGSFIMQLLTPDALKPIMEVYGDTNYFGSSIANAPREGVARADQGRTSTHPFWHKMARMALRYGITDQPPEYYRHLMQGYGAGPLRLLGAVMDLVDSGDSPTSTKYDPDGYDGIEPWLRAIGATTWIGRPRDTMRGMFYDYRRELNTRIQQAGLKMTLPENKGKKFDAEAYRRKVLEDSDIFTDEEIEDYELMHRIDSQLMARNKEFNEKYKDAWLQAEYVDEVKDWFREDHDAKTELFRDFVEQSNYYRRQRMQ